MLEGRMIRNNLPAKGRTVITRLGMGKLGSTAQRRAKIRIVLLGFVRLLDAREPVIRGHSIVLWIAWKR